MKIIKYIRIRLKEITTFFFRFLKLLVLIISNMNITDKIKKNMKVTKDAKNRNKMVPIILI